MKLIWHYIITTLWAACLLASCSETSVHFEEKPSEEVQHEEAVYISLTVPSAVTTRAGEVDENEITSIDVIFFKRSGSAGAYEYRFDGGEYNLKFEKVGSGPEALYQTSFLPPYFTEGVVWHVLVITNATHTIKGVKSSWTTTMTMDDVQETLIASLPLKDPAPIDPDENPYFIHKEHFLGKDKTGIPMYALLADKELNDRKAKQLGRISVIRMVAKFTITNNLTYNSVDKKMIYIREASLVNDYKNGHIHTDFFISNSAINPGYPTIPKVPVKANRKLEFTNIDDEDETNPQLIEQTITFYAFESKNSEELPGSGQEIIYLDNKFINNCNDPDPSKRIYTHIRLETDYNGDPNDPITYFLAIPKVVWNMNAPIVYTNQLGDILRNHHYKLTIKGASRTQLVDAYVEIVDWKDRPIKIEDLE